MKKIIFLILILPAIVFSQSDYSLKFDGTDDYVSLPTGIVDLTSPYTVEAWINVEDFSVTATYRRRIMVLRDASDNDLDLAVHENNNLTFVAEGTNKITSETYSANTWYHIALVYDGANYALYVNGIAQTLSDGGIGTNNSGSNSLIGATYSSGYIGNFFGQIDEVRVWNDERTVAEIRANMNKGLTGSEANLVAYYKMSDGSGTSLTDNSTNSNTGTLTNGPAWHTSGAFADAGNTLDFDGTNDYVVTSGNVNITGNSSRTVELLVNVTTNESQNTPLLFYGTGSTNQGFGIVINNNHAKSTFYNVSKEGATTLATNTWYHIAVTWDGTTRKIYLNGVLDGEDTPGNTNTGSGPLYLARMEGCTICGDNAADVYIDEVRIWNDVRTQSEIVENMFRTFNGDETNLDYYYRFDQDPVSGQTVLYDMSGNSNNGTLTNMDETAAWVSSGAFTSWLGGESTTWSDSKNWTNGVPGSSSNVGIINRSNSSSPSISGSPTVENLVVGSSVSSTLTSGLNVNGNLILESKLDLNGQTITLGSSGHLEELSGNISGATGSITTTRTLNNISAENVGGLGAVITTPANMGSTVITRTHSEYTKNSNNSILRAYSITPTNNTGLNATLVFNYSDSELNGLTEGDLVLFNSTDGGTNWTLENGTVNTTNNTITLTGIRWIFIMDGSFEFCSFACRVSIVYGKLCW